MNKSERLLQLMTLLRGKRRASTAKVLAEKLNVSERTIYRDIQSLIYSGIDISGEAGVGYLLQPGSEIPSIMFSEKELEALVLGIRLLKGWADDDLVAAASQAIEKIKAVVPAKVGFDLDKKTTKFLVPPLARKEDIQFSELLRGAIDTCQVVSLQYISEEGKESNREIRPLGLMFWGQVWTIASWCELRGAYRLFRLDRIQTAVLTKKVFELSERCNFADYISQYESNVAMGFWDD